MLSVVQNIYGMGETTILLPSVLGRGGVERVLMPKLDDIEVEALRKSAETISKSVEIILKSII
ncbi:MAG: hypothetical protein V1874_13845 [Spirochaetota bacterium]